MYIFVFYLNVQVNLKFFRYYNCFKLIRNNYSFYVDEQWFTYLLQCVFIRKNIIIPYVKMLKYRRRCIEWRLHDILHNIIRRCIFQWWWKYDVWRLERVNSCKEQITTLPHYFPKILVMKTITFLGGFWYIYTYIIVPMRLKRKGIRLRTRKK